MRTLGATDGDLDFTLIDGIESLRQRLVQRLLFWRGEWFLDTSQGVPYLPSVLGRQGSLTLLRQVITAYIEVDDEVTGVRNIEIEFRPTDRRAGYRADVDTIHGTIEQFEVVTPTLPLIT